MTDLNENEIKANEKIEYVINKSMEIIMNSGDARNFASEAMGAIAKCEFDRAKELLSKAEKVQTEAHVIQTEMIQGDIRGGDEKMIYSVLFAHAQDTLMTIQVEINMTKQLLKLQKANDERFKKLEGKI
ncbi:MAG: PTS lactose/cellobiose transporter subunit IIA [Erysipelotrichaceae bacterium]|nr:PTS lactose/cellobiose transporter subunit IIA [Erysipelotrichaceae bacterium]MDY6034843.1 PTS lactose/cellobiose transporter subunit IIA [Bulleidia sp.]